MAPTKPTNIDIDKLKDALSDLQDLQDLIAEPPADTFENLPSSIKPYLQSGSNGLQGDTADILDNRYHSCAYTFNQAWTDVKTGITTLQTLLQTTITKHETADKTAHNNATKTQTGAGGSGSSSGGSGANTGTTSTAATKG